MSADLLFEQFATLVTAPNGIARLRELILQLAVQGKLGTQDTRDEPANVLVDKIRKARVKIDKKWKKFDPISDSDLPYRLPSGWVWNRLGDVVILKSGSSFDQSSNQFDSGIPYVKVGDMNNSGNEKIITTSSRFVKKTEENSSEIIPKNSIIFPKRGGAIATNKKRIVNSEIFVDSNTMAMICPDSINLGYLYSWFSQVDLWSLNSGTSVPQINNKDIDPLLFPLPPLAEQHRIVAKVDRLMALCDELEARQQKERAGCLRLGIASLAGLQDAESVEEFGRQWAQVCNEFDLILDCPENVAVLRQTILQLAVQGRLVRQEPGDEPARKLVDRIKKEKERLVNTGKIRKLPELNPISLAEQPYKLPHGWSWEHLNDVYDVRDGTHETPKYFSHGIPFLTSKNLSTGSLDFTNINYISQEDHQKFSHRSIVEKFDILIAMVGTIGNPVIVDTDKEFSVKNIALFKYYSLNLSSPKFLFYFLQLATEKMSAKASFGVQSFVSLKYLREYPIPLPPLAEQHRIVAKVDALMALCDALESRLKERAGVQGRLAGAVVKQVTG